MKYRIIKRDEMFELIEAVNKAIEEGWRPQGGVSIAEETAYIIKKIIFAQAMVRDK